MSYKRLIYFQLWFSLLRILTGGINRDSHLGRMSLSASCQLSCAVQKCTHWWGEEEGGWIVGVACSSTSTTRIQGSIFGAMRAWSAKEKQICTDTSITNGVTRPLDINLLIYLNLQIYCKICLVKRYPILTVLWLEKNEYLVLAFLPKNLKCVFLTSNQCP